MQTVLTIAIDSIAIASALYLSVGFILHLASKIEMPRSKVSPGQLELDLTPAAVAAVVETAIAAPTVEQVWCDAIVPFVRRQIARDWSAMKPAELRQACQQQGVKWRNAHGKNKHLTKGQMIAALSA